MKIDREGSDLFHHRITEYGGNVSSKRTVQHVRRDVNGPITTTKGAFTRPLISLFFYVRSYFLSISQSKRTVAEK